MLDHKYQARNLYLPLERSISAQRINSHLTSSSIMHSTSLTRSWNICLLRCFTGNTFNTGNGISNLNGLDFLLSKCGKNGSTGNKTERGVHCSGKSTAYHAGNHAVSSILNRINCLNCSTKAMLCQEKLRTYTKLNIWYKYGETNFFRRQYTTSSYLPSQNNLTISIFKEPFSKSPGSSS